MGIARCNGNFKGSLSIDPKSLSNGVVGRDTRAPGATLPFLVFISAVASLLW